MLLLTLRPLLLLAAAAAAAAAAATTTTLAVPRTRILQMVLEIPESPAGAGCWVLGVGFRVKV